MVRYDFNKDVNEAVKSVEEKLERYCRRDPCTMVGRALDEVWDRLDIALIGADRSDAAKRIEVMNVAMDRLKSKYNKKQKLSDYFSEDKAKKQQEVEDRKLENRLRRFLKKFHF